MSLTYDVKETLLGWIRAGKFPPGSQLPSVPDLVRRLEVSRTVVRESIQALAAMKLIDVRPGLGCFVRAVRPEMVVNSDVMSSLLDIDGLIDVAVARQVIEGGVARLAAVKADAEAYEEMEAALEKIERQVKKNQPMYAITPEFHIAVARATGNEVLASTVASFNSLMTAAGEVIERAEVGTDYRLAEYESHRDLLEVLRLRKPDKAQVAMEKHIELTVARLRVIRAASS